MPMIVDPSAPQITPPATVVSPEGWLTAVVDAPWAGVVLSYNGATPPAVRNLVLNPSTEVDLSNTALYSWGTRERVTTDARYGSACVQHTQTSGGTFCGTQYAIEPAAAGKVLRASAYVKVPGTGTTCFFSFRSASTTLGTVSVGTPAAGTWQRITAEFVVPAGQTCTQVAPAYNAPTGTVWWSDAMQVEAGVTAASAYVDGSLPGGSWEGQAHASPSIRATAVPNAAAIRKVRILRTSAGNANAPVRSGDLAWAVEGIGQAYDHEAPLGVPSIYTATPQYADGTWGPATSLAVTPPAPAPNEFADLWVKSVDDPGLSMRAMLLDPAGTTSAGRQDTASRSGSAYTAVAYDTAGAPSETVTVDVPTERVDQMRELLRSGVLLAQVRPEYKTPDRFFVPGDVAEKPTGKLGSSGGYQFTFDIVPIERPATEGQHMAAPGWSYDALAAQFATYDAVEASYPSYASLASNGAV